MGLAKRYEPRALGTFFAALQHCIVRDVKEELGTGTEGTHSEKFRLLSQTMYNVVPFSMNKLKKD